MSYQIHTEEYAFNANFYRLNGYIRPDSNETSEITNICLLENVLHRQINCVRTTSNVLFMFT